LSSIFRSDEIRIGIVFNGGLLKEKIREYTIEGLIGRGGMGSVYLATHVHLQTRAALKVLLERFSDNVLIKERFVNEARILHQLRHSNIVEQREFFEENGRLVLVMEYVDGRPLDKMIGQDSGPIPWEKTLPLFIQILDGIGYAHSKGIVHRDIKPASILISKEGQVKVTDLGIAKIAGDQGMTRTGAQMGTLRYESPEQIRGAKDVDHRSDIYSLGMTLYEMLAGRLPFETDGVSSEFEVMKLIVNRTVNFDPKEYYPHIPEWLVEIIHKATEIDPGSRFQSCEEFKQQIIEHEDLPSIQNSYWSGRVEAVKTQPISVPISASSASNDQVASDSFCPECEAPVVKGMEFCGKCGTYLMQECPVCSLKVRWFNEFCPRCGAQIAEKLLELDEEKERQKYEHYMLEQERADQILRMEEQKRNSQFLSSMNFIKIPSGQFMMGSNSREMRNCLLHSVDITVFELLSTPVTQLMWAYLMRKNPSFFEDDSKPVERVSWKDCHSYLQKLNDLDTDHTYRLPSEAEWEYACRAGTATIFHWGSSDSEDLKDRSCWHSENSANSTHRVGKKEPNQFGLFDMCGNVWEWCEDVYHDNYEVCPTDGSPFLGSGMNRVRRGGSWSNSALNCTSLNRMSNSSGFRYQNIGFRIVRTVRVSSTFSESR